MEEDIKLLENFIRVYKELNKKSTDFYFNKAEIPIEIIENLIKEYNYMCKLYYDLGSNYCDLDEKNKKLEKENQSYRDYFGTPPCYDNADYIPKSKVREFLEKSKVVKNESKDKTYLLIDVSELNKELLQEGDDK